MRTVEKLRLIVRGNEQKEKKVLAVCAVFALHDAIGGLRGGIAGEV